MSITVENFNNESWFKISNSHEMRPFFMSMVSDSDHWMFISSNGGLSAGRKNAEFSLFPYYTDDKITEFAQITGSKTIFQVKGVPPNDVWEPFCELNAVRYNISRNLYKNLYGNKIIFEEVNHDLRATFRYEWNSSDKFGFIRRSTLTNNSDSELYLKVLDGIQNVLPASVNADLQNRSSNLLDAYKRTELVEETGMGIFALSAIPVDKAEPSEALKANVAWSYGLDNPKYLLSSLQLDSFRNDGSIVEEKDVKGEKGAYFLSSDLTLGANTSSSWTIIANTNLDHAAVVSLNDRIQNDETLTTEVDEDVQTGVDRLKKLIASSDGFQHTADPLKDARHYSNVLFNIMRGGIFDDSYNIEKDDFLAYLKHANKEAYSAASSTIKQLGETFTKFELDEVFDKVDNPDVLRLAKEYLPLKFSRRHGDPSRPWNKFSINTKNEHDGSKVLDYEGNWRDIFQNWEALVHSYPGFIEGMIFKFLNASTFDGYNPYRVTKGGFDWETIEADDPWSYIGYWGDHQIIYLLKFLEFYQAHDPEALQSLFNESVFVYANVPYIIKPYSEIVKNSKDTIDFDFDSDELIQERIEKMGADGASLTNASGDIHRVNFVEKILATVASKVSNFIPEAGIWMNTQRPEWNDANNALVGNGVSMVTLYYLRRFLRFFEPLLDSQDSEVEISVELKTFIEKISEVLSSHSELLSGSIDDKHRKAVTDGLGEAGSEFRVAIYESSFSGKKATVSTKELAGIFGTAAEFMEHSIRVNKRVDNLYHAYNLMTYTDAGIEINYLDEMLEGQVAVLSSKYLSAQEAVNVLDALRKSALYREDQNSYILYPNKQLPGFLERNNVTKDQVSKSSLLTKMSESGDRRLISKDVNGGYHFNGNFKNAGDLSKAIDLLIEEGNDLAKAEKDAILKIYEEVFNHKAFTGRSGTFYGYEGLGSIYWHMVSKLYLAVHEVCDQAKAEGAAETVQAELATHFYEVGDGIGIHKTPEVYGAFPTDPYSHTPFTKGAQQPGMTGQVKEDILARYGELGLSVVDGALQFEPHILRKSEFSEKPKSISMRSLSGDYHVHKLEAGSLLFSLCQVPIVYQIGAANQIEIAFAKGNSQQVEGVTLGRDLSNKLFKHTGEIERITVHLTEAQLR